ncbi:sushi, von Willebrand factor type A, EGF and pentraxin domain-containing protein 1-like isoform X2 [Ostrea edulis]|uniref:sushi, von Willebrand factor type A, EGF and pentraxin domain-containing protein 1-like isoform X2 n=1 Tax=Ostrea edulis TaxID=37623 RepID=UPI0024AEF768|nr:sushi, von Willebrand factor type A, EGF and pentraxin domain-containing protein 1-like isoform X2 [Ostrea edulis]
MCGVSCSSVINLRRSFCLSATFRRSFRLSTTFSMVPPSMVDRYILFLISLTLTVEVVWCGYALTWDHCHCRWADWMAWSDCSRTCGGGERYRTREVWMRTDICTLDFNNCATDDMGYEYEKCNTICYNGGTYTTSGYCSCVTGWYGSCCSNEITCGNPGSVLSNGIVTGSEYTYGKTVTYSCNAHYNLTGGSVSRTCQSNQVWSGTQPRCAFVNSCASNPCLNGGTCVNGLDRYDCLCTSSFNGVNCENDIQPPVMTNCPSDMSIFSNEPTIFVNWTAPSFYDPVGKSIEVSMNYPDDSWTFPWGDYVAQYVALKPSNGLRTECTFNITIRPHQCPELNVPVNGARVCNGWKTDFGQFCLVYCGGNYSLALQYDHSQWYVCGSSGNWIASGPLPNCTDLILTNGVLNSFSTYRFSDCSDSDETDRIQRSYVEKLKTSNYNYFCDKYSSLCSEANVDVAC